MPKRHLRTLLLGSTFRPLSRLLGPVSTLTFPDSANFLFCFHCPVELPLALCRREQRLEGEKCQMLKRQGRGQLVWPHETEDSRLKGASDSGVESDTVPRSLLWRDGCSCPLTRHAGQQPLCPGCLARTGDFLCQGKSVESRDVFIGFSGETETTGGIKENWLP